MTELIHRAERGDEGAAAALYETMYGDLRKVAHARLRRSGRNGELDTVALVNESYMRFVKSGSLHINDRVHFMRWSGRAMRSIIVDAARRRLAGHRGGGAAHVPLTSDLPEAARGAEDIVRVHEALERLAVVDGRLARVVELRYFAGLREAEIAEALGVTDRTVRRAWEKARLLLKVALE